MTIVLPVLVRRCLQIWGDTPLERAWNNRLKKERESEGHMRNYSGIFSVATLKVLFEQKEQTPPIIDALVGQLYNPSEVC